VVTALEYRKITKAQDARLATAPCVALVTTRRATPAHELLHDQLRPAHNRTIMPNHPLTSLLTLSYTYMKAEVPTSKMY